MACRYSLSAAENCFSVKYWFPFSTCSRARAELRQAGSAPSIAAKKKSTRPAGLPREEMQRDRIILISGSGRDTEVRLDSNLEVPAFWILAMRPTKNGTGPRAPTLEIRCLS